MMFFLYIVGMFLVYLIPYGALCLYSELSYRKMMREEDRKIEAMLAAWDRYKTESDNGATHGR